MSLERGAPAQTFHSGRSVREFFSDHTERRQGELFIAMSALPSLPPTGSITFTGTSMFPELMDGDRLAYRRQNVYRRGDVILYPEPGGEERYIIHRVIRVEGEALKTAGDNNSMADPYTVSDKRVVGRIENKTRTGRRSTVWGGGKGFLRYWYARRGKGALQRAYSMIEPAYRQAARLVSPVLSSIIPPRPVIVIFPDSRIRVWLCTYRWCAGWWNHRGKNWYVRPEFLLFIDPARLPDYEEILRGEGLRHHLRGRK